MRRDSTLCSKGVQILLCIIAASALLLLLSPPHVKRIRINLTSKRSIIKQEAIDPSEQLYDPVDIIDYRRCPPLEPLRIFVHSFNNPLAKALANHPTAIKDEHEACILIGFTDGESPHQPHSWNSVAEPGINHVIININDKISIEPEGREMIVQANFENGAFRPLLDFSLFPDVKAFNSSTWRQRPSIMPLERDAKFTIVVDKIDETNPSPIHREIVCKGDCSFSLLSSTFCFLPPSRTFHSRLFSVLRAGCIPVVMSPSQPLPFQEYLDWRLASFRFPMSMLAFVPEMLEKLPKEDVMEMRRRGRIFLARIDDAEALSASFVAALSERIQIGVPMHPKVPSNLIPPSNEFNNASYSFTRISSRFQSQSLSSSRLYSHGRWNSGRDLTYTPKTLHDVPQMPGDAPFHEGTKENLVAVNKAVRLGLTRDEEQFTVVILTYNRDNGVRKILERLRDCPYLNKVIVLWNNHERRPNGTWPEIHVPVEFVLTERNSLLSRFLPYDRIETEAVVSMDDDMVVAHPELTFAFRMWRENRDRLVGFPERRHTFHKGKGKYGFSSGACEHSLILTGFAFMHKEFLFEFSYNQHPSILEFIDKNRNCEDLAMNYLISHLTRKPPLKVVKKERLNQSQAAGLSSRGGHYKERDEYTQEVARPNGSCVKGL